MNLGLEYLLRHSLNKNFFELPCSIFLEKPPKRSKRQDRMAVYIDQKNDQCSVKQWLLTDCESEQLLPPMEEFYVQNVMNELELIIPKQYRPIQYIPGAVIDRQNTWRKPMNKETHDKFHNQIIRSPWNKAWKVLWLWETFTWVYFDSDKADSPVGRMLRMDKGSLENRQYPIMCKYLQRDMRVAAEQYPKIYSIWEKWQQNILLPSNSPGELIFADPQSYFEMAKKRRFPALDRFRMPRFKKATPAPAPPTVPAFEPPPNPFPELENMTEEKKKMLLNAVKQMHLLQKKMAAAETENEVANGEDWVQLIYGGINNGD